MEKTRWRESGLKVPGDSPGCCFNLRAGLLAEANSKGTDNTRISDNAAKTPLEQFQAQLPLSEKYHQHWKTRQVRNVQSPFLTMKKDFSIAKQAGFQEANQHWNHAPRSRYLCRPQWANQVPDGRLKDPAYPGFCHGHRKHSLIP